MKSFTQRVVSTVALTAAVTLTCLPENVQAQERRVNTVDVTVVVESDGTATVTNRVEWKIDTSSGMGGFDFMNPALNNIQFENQFVDLGEKTERMPVKVKKKVENSNTIWMLDTINGRVPKGTAYWTFTYKGNLIHEGYLGKTTSSEHGELYYFHWHPVQWADALKYRNVKIVLPVPVEGTEISDAEFQEIAGYTRTSGMNDGNAKTAQILTDKQHNRSGRRG